MPPFPTDASSSSPARRRVAVIGAASSIGIRPYDEPRLALERLGRAELRGSWIHLDADVLDPSVMAAVDSPEPGGPSISDLAALLTPLVRHPCALGMQLTIYDPALDLDRSCGKRSVALLEEVLASDTPESHYAVLDGQAGDCS